MLVHTPDKVPRGQRNSMSHRRIAQLLCLFAITMNGQDTHRLAFVNWFETRGRADSNSGMYHVRRTTRNGVISIENIERGVHLIPKFGSEVGPTWEMKKRIEKERRMNEIYTTVEGHQESEERITSVGAWLDVVPYYDDFLLNNWIDSHAYKTIY